MQFPHKFSQVRLRVFREIWIFTSLLFPPFRLVPFPGQGPRHVPIHLSSGWEREILAPHYALVGYEVLRDCTTVVAATKGGGAAAPSELRPTRDPIHETPRLRDGADYVCTDQLYRAREQPR